MGWFDEQIKQRKNQDYKAFSQSFTNTADSVMGPRFSFSFDVADIPLNQILKYYHFQPMEIPSSIESSEDAVKYVCHYTGLATRTVKLDNDWYKYAYGAFLAVRSDTNTAVALIPRNFQSYWFYDTSTGSKKRVTKKNCRLFENALCFYRPLPSKKLTITDILKHISKSFSAFDVLMFLFSVLTATLLGFLLPKLNWFLFSYVSTENNISLLISTVVFVLCAGISRTVFTTVGNILCERIENKATLSLDAAVMMRVMTLPAGFFRDNSSGEIISRMEFMKNSCTMLLNTLNKTVLPCCFSLMYINQIFSFTPVMAKAATLVIFMRLTFSALYSFVSTKVVNKSMQTESKESAMTLDIISGIQKVKLAGAQKRMFTRWANIFSETTRITYNPPLICNIGHGINIAIELFGMLFFFFLAGTQGVQTADFYAFLSAYGLISGSLAQLSIIADSISKIGPGFVMAKPILEAIPETRSKPESIGTLKGSIELANVSFKYTDDSPNIIENLSLKIKPGEYVSIVGKTGCGKSTLVRLLLGFETPQKGSVFYDSKDITSLDIQELRRHIGTVMQDGKLFIGDIYSNIVVCNPSLDLDAAWEAAELAGIADEIREMPMGMFTLIGDDIGGISGGQRQRIIIARAVATKPNILIFDEATSALDNITQKKVSQALDSLKCTRIVIAHRLSTIRNTDRIIVLDNGKIIEEGTYNQLIEKNGFFKDLVERQQLEKQT